MCGRSVLVTSDEAGGMELGQVGFSGEELVDLYRYSSVSTAVQRSTGRKQIE